MFICHLFVVTWVLINFEGYLVKSDVHSVESNCYWTSYQWGLQLWTIYLRDADLDAPGLSFYLSSLQEGWASDVTTCHKSCPVINYMLYWRYCERWLVIHVYWLCMMKGFKSPFESTVFWKWVVEDLHCSCLIA